MILSLDEVCNQQSMLYDWDCISDELDIFRLTLF